MDMDQLFDVNPEQTIYEWVDLVLAPIDEVIYVCSKQINNVMKEILLYVY